ncbi:hypothetical protein SAMN05216600_11875 [Pseudomonas cuatrocienegasensis]|uniref:Uncharacterized protein n=1 Tax=Pseudomonas cuatrocienegasensis TaxID=543360 RepID=A0ABY1BN32_9PSED|nr:MULTISPECIES: hypothetical protein [Pseudomonas]OEC33425.1 hypothetical protein A7D25_18845 [Pseudomonas sp. 21C1]SER22932.1 hypothetical protein SAMN05216600_11875 [Pseudomonas cuatrocienegasensis]
MTSITSSTPAMVSYYTSQANALSAKTDTNAEGAASSDPLAELRRYAGQVVARSEGGLLRALNNGTGTTASSSATAAGGASGSAATATIPLPDVADLDRDEANKLLGQVQTLIDQGLDKSISFSGVNGDKETQSLDTYRQWLQEKGGISVYA